MADTSAQPAMEDILDSIRTSMAEETAKVGSGSTDLIDAAAEQDGDDDVLELSADDMVGEDAGSGEDDELIDISAFASSGEAKPVIGAGDLANELLDEVGAASPAVSGAEGSEAGAADEFDRLLAEISQEQQQQVAAAEVTKQALMDEEEPLGTETVADDVAAQVPEASEVAGESLRDKVEAVAVAELGERVAGLAPSYQLSTVEGAGGVQVAFPAEVLAMALRPMVQDWLSKNLPGVVEKLVKEEISKLTQN